MLCNGCGGLGEIASAQVITRFALHVLAMTLGGRNMRAMRRTPAMGVVRRNRQHSLRTNLRSVCTFRFFFQ